MTSIFTPDQMREQLRAKNVGEEAIIRALAREFGPAAAAHFVHVVPDVRLDFPIRFTLPWSALCSDNFREAASMMRSHGKLVPRKVLTARYKAAKAKTREIAGAAMGQFPALARPFALVASVYLPDARTHDVCNFAKCCHDAIEGVVVVNDHWLHRITWERIGTDVDAPRAEISLTPL